MLMSEFSESKELIPAEMLMCVSFTSGEWPSTVWGAGINPLNFSVCMKLDSAFVAMQKHL